MDRSDSTWQAESGQNGASNVRFTPNSGHCWVRLRCPHADVLIVLARARAKFRAAEFAYPHPQIDWARETQGAFARFLQIPEGLSEPDLL